MNRVGSLLILVALLTACGQTATGSSGSCVGPYLDAQPPGGRYGAPAPTVRAGHQVTIYGHWFTSTCNDTVVLGPDRSRHSPFLPLPPVKLTLALPGGTVIPLGLYTPDGRDMGFSTTVHIPKNTPAGSATVSDDHRHLFRFSVRRR